MIEQSGGAVRLTRGTPIAGQSARQSSAPHTADVRPMIMRAHREIFIRSPGRSENDFIALFKQFANESTNWQYMEPQSTDYTTHSGNPSCMILRLDHPDRPAVALTPKGRCFYFVPNIIPCVPLGELDLPKYNAVAENFAADLRMFVRGTKPSVTISTTSDDLTLKQIIKGPKIRARFESYLAGYPRTFHPSDLQQLDRFTCALFRAPKAYVDLYRLERYLIENLKWPPNDARACIERIEVGMDVLKEHKRF